MQSRKKKIICGSLALFFFSLYTFVFIFYLSNPILGKKEAEVKKQYPSVVEFVEEFCSVLSENPSVEELSEYFYREKISYISDDKTLTALSFPERYNENGEFLSFKTTRVKFYQYCVGIGSELFRVDVRNIYENYTLKNKFYISDTVDGYKIYTVRVDYGR